jgi:hypothetical protein
MIAQNMKARPAFLVLVGLLLPCLASEAAEVMREGAMEKLALVRPEDPKTWSAAESTTAPVRAPVKVGASSWHWHVDVDYHAGEAKYPIGWPRINHAIAAGPARDWSDWDFVHGWIYVATSRSALPREPAGLAVQGRDRATAFNRALTELKKDAWVELTIPVRQIPHFQDVRSVQFHIAEANYQDGDRLDFYLNDLALTRYAEPTLFDLIAENAVVFSGATRLPVRFQLLGVKSGERAEVTCALVRAGVVVTEAHLAVGRGAQRLVLEPGTRTLAPGDYELRARVGERSSPVSTTVRVVESPWK